MNCLNCGGGLKPIGNRNYFRCPYCETFHFPEELNDGVALVLGETNYDCPVCAKGLARAAIEGHDVCYCKNCRGFLTTNRTFGVLVRLKRANLGSLPHEPLPFDQVELARRLQCPSCRKPMDTHPYHAGGNAVIDTCHRCRIVWLDAGELTVLGRYRGRSGPVATPPSREVPEAAKEPEPNVISLFGFPIHLS